MAFPDLLRPTGLRWLLGPRLVQNQSGFQGAHVLGNSFWNTSIAWLGLLGFPDNADTLSNGVLLPESERGNLVLGAASHLGNHFGAFDALFYDVNSTADDPSNLYLNVLEDARKIAVLGLTEGSPEWEEVNLTYRIQVRNFLDYQRVRRTCGWAMPAKFPPRNGRTSKALRSLGYGVQVHVS